MEKCPLQKKKNDLRTFSDLGGGKFRLFIFKIHLKFRKETTVLINIWMPIINKKNVNFNFEEKCCNKPRPKILQRFWLIYIFLSDFDLPRLIVFVLKIHEDLPLEKFKNCQILPSYI